MAFVSDSVNSNARNTTPSEISTSRSGVVVLSKAIERF
jgi:hypothetical protein